MGFETEVTKTMYIYTFIRTNRGHANGKIDVFIEIKSNAKKI